LHAIDLGTLFDTTVAIPHHLHYIFAQARHQLLILNWPIII